MTIEACEQSRMLSVELVDDFAALGRLAPDWRELIASMHRPEPMLAPEWVLTWWDHYHDKRSLAVGVFRDGARVVGLAPLCRRTHRYRPGLPFRRLEVMGASGGEADGACGEYLAPLAAKGREVDVARSFAAALDQNVFGAWDELVIEHMDGRGPMTAALASALRVRHTVGCVPAMRAHYLPLPANWEAFLESVHGKRRNWFRRTWKDFVAWAGEGGYTLERARSKEGVREGMQILAELHGARWQESGHPGAFASPRFSAFHSAYAEKLLAADQLDLLWLTVGGAPVAAIYSFVSGGKVYFYQSGRQVGTPPNIRLGIVMFMLAIQDAMARGLSEFDFLGGDSTYKPYFTASTRPLVTLRVAPPSLRETTRRGLTWAARYARQLRPRAGHVTRGPEEGSLGEG